MAKKTLTLTALRTTHAEQIKEFNEMLHNPETKREQLTAQDKKIAETEADYAHQKKLGIYAEVETSTDPVAAFIARDHFYTLTHKVKKEKVKDAEGNEIEIVTGYEVVDDTSGDKRGKRVRLDLMAFCVDTKRSTLFKYRVAELNKLLLLWGMKLINCTDEEILKVNDSYYMEKEVDCYRAYIEQITDKDGKIDPTKANVPSPISSKSLLKKLQECFDAVPTNGKMAATSNMLGGLKLTYSAKGKEPTDIRLITDAKFMDIFQNACYSAVTNKKFGFVGYITKEQYAAAAKKAEEKAAKEKAKAEENAAETEKKPKKTKTKAKTEAKTKAA